MSERYTTEGSALLDSGFHIGNFISAEHAERIAAAMNAAGVVEALPSEMTLERSPALYDGVSGQQAYVWGYNDCRAAALAAVKGVES